ncbi:phage head completion protein [Symbiopectobacterium sp. Eva_TO]
MAAGSEGEAGDDPMRAGGLRHRVTIQHFTTIRDAGGQPIKTWRDTATVISLYTSFGHFLNRMLRTP